MVQQFALFSDKFVQLTAVAPNINPASAVIQLRCIHRSGCVEGFLGVCITHNNCAVRFAYFMSDCPKIFSDKAWALSGVTFSSMALRTTISSSLFIPSKSVITSWLSDVERSLRGKWPTRLFWAPFSPGPTQQCCWEQRSRPGNKCMLKPPLPLPESRRCSSQYLPIELD